MIMSQQWQPEYIEIQSTRHTHTHRHSCTHTHKSNTHTANMHMHTQHTNAYTRTYAHTCTHTMHMHKHTQMHTCTHTCTTQVLHTYTCQTHHKNTTHTCTHKYTHTCMHTHAHTTHTYAYTHSHTTHVYTHTHTHMHIHAHIHANTLTKIRFNSCRFVLHQSSAPSSPHLRPQTILPLLPPGGPPPLVGRTAPGGNDLGGRFLHQHTRPLVPSPAYRIDWCYNGFRVMQRRSNREFGRWVRLHPLHGKTPPFHMCWGEEVRVRVVCICRWALGGLGMLWGVVARVTTGGLAKYLLPMGAEGWETL